MSSGKATSGLWSQENHARLPRFSSLGCSLFSAVGSTVCRKGSDRGPPHQHYWALYACGWPADSWPAFTLAVGSWVLALGTLNPASGHCPSSRARYLCCLICCPGPALTTWRTAHTLQMDFCVSSPNGQIILWGHQTIANLFWRLGCILCLFFLYQVSSFTWRCHKETSF